MFALNAGFVQTLPLGSDINVANSLFTELVFSQTKVSKDGSERCLCKGKLGTKSWIFSYRNQSNVKFDICKSCVLIIREESANTPGFARTDRTDLTDRPDRTDCTVQMIDFTRRVHLFGASGIFSGRDPNSGDQIFRIRDPRPSWLQKMIGNPIGIKILKEGKKVFIVVGAKSGNFFGF